MDGVSLLSTHHHSSNTTRLTTFCPLHPHTFLFSCRTPAFSCLYHRPRLPSVICRAALEPQQKKKGEKVPLPDFFEIDRDAETLNLIWETTQALKTAKHYEVVFLVHEERVEELQDLIQKVKDFIEEKKGKIFRLNDWGMRKLAYKIKKAKRANYILMNLQIGAQAINELNYMLEKDERVIRHLVITRKRAETIDTMPPPEFSSLREDSDLDEEYDDEEEFEDDEEEEVDDEDKGVEDEEAEEAQGTLTKV